MNVHGATAGSAKYYKSFIISFVGFDFIEEPDEICDLIMKKMILIKKNYRTEKKTIY